MLILTDFAYTSQTTSFATGIGILLCVSLILLKLFITFEFMFVFGYDHQLPWKCCITDVS